MINELTTKINSFDKHVRMDDTVIMVNIYAGGQVRVFFCSLTKRAWVFYVVLILRRN